MKMIILLFVLLIHLLTESGATFVRVETGHQNIAISGRDVYFGHYTRLFFRNLTCISTIDIHCLRPLTGAEEIDLLYSECTRGQWKVAHYTNSKHHFRLKFPIWAQRLSISSRKELSIIDVQVEYCANNSSAGMPPTCRPSTHPHRHGRSRDILHASDVFSRTKRSADLQEPISNSQNEVLGPGVHEILVDKLVAKGDSLTILAGAIVRFDQGAGITVQGKLFVNGSFAKPAHFEAIGGRWKGISFIDGEKGSILSYANVSGAEVGVSVTSGVAPILDHVIVDDNIIGVRILNQTDKSTTKLNKVTSVNNEENGIEIIGKV